MPKKKKRDSRGLAEILESTSDVLFPEDFGQRPIKLNTRGANGDTPLHVMLWRGDTYAAELLIDAGIDVNAIGDMGETPLHVAIRRENAKAVRALIQAGARSNVRSEFGQMAVDVLDDCNPEFRELAKEWFNP